MGGQGFGHKATTPSKKKPTTTSKIKTTTEDDGSWHPQPGENWVSVKPAPKVTWFRCPKKAMKKGCKVAKACLYPNVKDCTTFIQCVPNIDGKRGKPVISQCPAGLFWNSNARACDYQENSTCEKDKEKQKEKEAKKQGKKKPGKNEPETKKPRSFFASFFGF